MPYKIVPNIINVKGLANTALSLHTTKQFTSNTSSNNTIQVVDSHRGNVIHATTGNVFMTSNLNHTVGDTFKIYNNSSSNVITFTQNSGVTIHFSNTVNPLSNSYTGNRQIGPRGFATVTCIANNHYTVSGIGVV